MFILLSFLLLGVSATVWRTTSDPSAQRDQCVAALTRVDPDRSVLVDALIRGRTEERGFAHDVSDCLVTVCQPIVLGLGIITSSLVADKDLVERMAEVVSGWAHTANALDSCTKRGSRLAKSFMELVSQEQSTDDDELESFATALMISAEELDRGACEVELMGDIRKFIPESGWRFETCQLVEKQSDGEHNVYVYNALKGFLFETRGKFSWSAEPTFTEERYSEFMNMGRLGTRQWLAGAHAFSAHKCSFTFLPLARSDCQRWVCVAMTAVHTMELSEEFLDPLVAEYLALDDGSKQCTEAVLDKWYLWWRTAVWGGVPLIPREDDDYLMTDVRDGDDPVWAEARAAQNGGSSETSSEQCVDLLTRMVTALSPNYNADTVVQSLEDHRREEFGYSAHRNLACVDTVCPALVSALATAGPPRDGQPVELAHIRDHSMQILKKAAHFDSPCNWVGESMTESILGSVKDFNAASRTADALAVLTSKIVNSHEFFGNRCTLDLVPNNPRFFRIYQGVLIPTSQDTRTEWAYGICRLLENTGLPDAPDQVHTMLRLILVSTWGPPAVSDERIAEMAEDVISVALSNHDPTWSYWTMRAKQLQDAQCSLSYLPQATSRCQRAACSAIVAIVTQFMDSLDSDWQAVVERLKSLYLVVQPDQCTTKVLMQTHLVYLSAVDHASTALNDASDALTVCEEMVEQITESNMQEST